MMCLAFIAVTAAMLADADSLRSRRVVNAEGETVQVLPGVRLTGEGDAPFDAPETYSPGCPEERELGRQATEAVKSWMPGTVCIIKRRGGGFGRDLGVLYVNVDGSDIRQRLLDLGLAQESKNADWCGEDGR